MPGDAAAAHAPVEHASELVQMLSADRDEHPIEPVVIRRAGDQESDRIPVTDDAKAPILVGKVGMQRRIGLEPRIASPFDGRRVGDDAPDFQDAVRKGLAKVVDRAFEAGQCRTGALPEHFADIGAQQRIPDGIEAVTIHREPAVRRFGRASHWHRPARRSEASAFDCHLVDIPRLGDQARHDQLVGWSLRGRRTAQPSIQLREEIGAHRAMDGRTG